MSRAFSQRHPHSRGAVSAAWLVSAALAIALVAVVFRDRWWPPDRGRIDASQSTAASAAEHDDSAAEPHDHQGHEHAGHDHEHPGHDELTSIRLSEQARKNIGLRVEKVELRQFTRSISIPGIVVERPGRSVIQVTAPLTGIVTRIEPTEGEAVLPGKKLFDLRLTHEELVQLQADLLRTVEELAVVGREIERIEKVTKDGGLAGKTLLERNYEKQKQLAVLNSQRQALELHGLTTAQVDDIIERRRLLQSLEVDAPGPTDRMTGADGSRYYQVRELAIAQGQHVNTGDRLAVLVDHAELFIEGNAFERDVPEINRAIADDTPVTALLEIKGEQPRPLTNLRILYAAPQIDPESRTLHFYVTLPNQIERNKQLEDGRRYVSWRYRPGQRTQLLIPVETWPDRIVLPVEAVVEDGAEAYVFTPNGDHFDRRAVHVEYKDPQSVVIANDGVLFPGDLVAMSAAKQLHLALKNKAGGGIDPHAGHNH